MLKDMEDKCRLVKEFTEQVNKQAIDKDLGKIHTLLAHGSDTHSERTSDQNTTQNTKVPPWTFPYPAYRQTCC